MKTILVIIVLIIIGCALFLFTGLYNVSADVKGPSMIEGALSAISSQSVSFHSANVKVPSLKDSTSYIAGLGYYITSCVFCHGGPGIGRSPVSQGLNPAPPSLVQSDISPLPKKTFWIVKHGIKMTGMPSFGKTLSEKTLWDIVNFVNSLPKLKENDFKSLKKNP